MVGFNKKTVKDISLAGKRVLLRADYNVPVEDGRIHDDYRIKKSLATIEYILAQKPARLVIISHLGRPEGVDKNLSLRPVASHLAKLLGQPVSFASDCIGEQTKAIINNLRQGGIILLENLRFNPGEKNDDKRFADELAKTAGADIFVQDAFAVAHRRDASLEAITRVLPSVGGLLLKEEVDTINQVMNKPAKPLLAIIAGAKMSDKIEMLEKFISIADCLAVGGAMANNFLLVQGHKIGDSLFDEGTAGEAKRIIKLAEAEASRRPFSLLLPVDVVVAKDPYGRGPTRIVDSASQTVADIEAYPKKPSASSYSVGKNEMILDLGPVSAAKIAGVAQMSKTVIWNGPLGVVETKGIAGATNPFAHASRMVAEAIVGHSGQKFKPYSFVGGGDTAAFVEAEGLIESFSFVSTGGGASLELMSGHNLPGISALPDKSK